LIIRRAWNSSTNTDVMPVGGCRCASSRESCSAGRLRKFVLVSRRSTEEVTSFLMRWGMTLLLTPLRPLTTVSNIARPLSRQPVTIVIAWRRLYRGRFATHPAISRRSILMFQISPAPVRTAPHGVHASAPPPVGLADRHPSRQQWIGHADGTLYLATMALSGLASAAYSLTVGRHPSHPDGPVCSIAERWNFFISGRLGSAQ